MQAKPPFHLDLAKFGNCQPCLTPGQDNPTTTCTAPRTKLAGAPPNAGKHGQDNPGLHAQQTLPTHHTPVTCYPSTLTHPSMDRPQTAVAILPPLDCGISSCTRCAVASSQVNEGAGRRTGPEEGLPGMEGTVVHTMARGSWNGNGGACAWLRCFCESACGCTALACAAPSLHMHTERPCNNSTPLTVRTSGGAQGAVGPAAAGTRAGLDPLLLLLTPFRLLSGLGLLLATLVDAPREVD
eukprot:scaffold181065_cov15-Tisochrysis_lutea.AAC.2